MFCADVLAYGCWFGLTWAFRTRAHVSCFVIFEGFSEGVVQKRRVAQRIHSASVLQSTWNRSSFSFFGLITHYSPTPACPASTPSRCCCSTRATSSSGPGVQKWRQSAFPISALGF